jgi:uncharacterized protein (DUF849 family)
MIQAALNGGRTWREHPAVPKTPKQLAEDARAVAAAGAACVHLHVRDEWGKETIAAADVARTLSAVRRAAPEGFPVSVSTGAWIVPDPAERLRIIESWTVLPEQVSANFHEEGAVELVQLLLSRGIGVEAGIINPAAAENLVRSGLAARCARLLIEPLEPVLDAAMANLQAMLQVLDAANISLPRLVHGYEGAAWPVLEFALARGWDTRIGLEDVLKRPNGSLATDNAELVATAVRIAARVKAV